jgi:hypothetical protein
VSSPLHFDDIKDVAHAFNIIVGVIIYDPHQEEISKQKTDNLGKMEESTKVVGAESDLDGILKAMKLVKDSCERVFLIQRFFDFRKQLPLFTRPDVKDMLDMPLFYQLGLESVDTEIHNITELELIVRKDPEMQLYFDSICNELHVLKEGQSNSETVLESYTKNELSHMMNTYIATGEKEACKIFHQYINALKCSFCQYPILTKDEHKKCYKKLMWANQDDIMGGINKYIENKGDIVMFSHFTDMVYSDKEPHKVKRANAILSITLVDSTEEYEDFIKSCNFNEKSGIFYPFLVPNKSLDKKGKDVLIFPVFYPMKIIEVETHVIPYKIVAEAPYCVNVLFKKAKFPYIEEFNKKNDQKFIDNYMKKIRDMASNQLCSKIFLRIYINIHGN